MSDCLINFVVDNCEIEVVCICSLQDIGLLLQALERFILHGGGMGEEEGWEKGKAKARWKSVHVFLCPHFIPVLEQAKLNDSWVGGQDGCVTEMMVPVL